jgi:hypothetical protein
MCRVDGTAGVVLLSAVCCEYFTLHARHRARRHRGRDKEADRALAAAVSEIKKQTELKAALKRELMGENQDMT